MLNTTPLDTKHSPRNAAIQGLLSLAFVGFLLLAPQAACGQVDLSDLGRPEGGQDARAGQLNSDGSVFAGSAYFTNQGDRAINWTASSGFQNLGAPWAGTGPQSYGWGVSADGSVTLGVFHAVSGYRACRWVAGQGLIELPGITGYRDLFLFATNINGTITVGRAERLFDLRLQPVRWSASGGAEVLSLPAGWTDGWLRALSTDGAVATGAGLVNSLERPIRWTAMGGVADLGLPAGWVSASAWALSDDGAVIVGGGYGPSGPRSFRWTAANGFQDLGLAPGWSSAYARGGDGDGTVIVGYGESPRGQRAWIWTPATGMRDLAEYLSGLGVALDGWTALSIANDVSGDSGVIVGSGTYLGQEHMWRATGLACSSFVRYESGDLGPIGYGLPREHAFAGLRSSAGDVRLRIDVRSDLNLPTEFVSVRLDGQPFATVFVSGANDCPTDSDLVMLTIPRKQFNSMLSDGTLNIRLEASPAVSATQCPNGMCTIHVEYDAVPIDCDGNGIEDRCQLFADPSLDCEHDGQLAACQSPGSYPACNANGIPDSCDLASGAQDKDGDGHLDECEYARGDLDLDGQVGPLTSRSCSVSGASSTHRLETSTEMV